MKSHARAALVAALVLGCLAGCTAKNTAASQVGSGLSSAADAAIATISADRIRARMRFLADDLLEGRGTGTRGYDIAAKYVAAEFEADGLTPAGDGGESFQRVPLRSSLADRQKSSMSVRHAGREESLAFGTDWTAPGDPGRDDVSVEAPVVFVGAGITAPDQHYDDYKGIDATGKIVAFFPAATPPFESALRAYYVKPENRAANAAAHGAAGLVVLYDSILEAQYPFSKVARDRSLPSFNWIDRQGRPNDYFEPLKGTAIVSLNATRRLLALGGHDADDVFKAAKAGTVKPFDMKVTARVRTVSARRDIASSNVVARLEGSDPALKNEYVVYAAHIDHLGIGAEVKGDRIYNGAIDNASGAAIMLELARTFSSMRVHPRRSILFMAVAGEEPGLLGSDFFAHNPTVAKGTIVAAVNLDNYMMLWPLRDVIVYGAEHSTLGAFAQQAAARLSLVVSPDPQPDEGIFVRSDHYSFVKQGVPAVQPFAGFKSDDPKIDPRAIWKRWEAEIYHQPQDDMQQPGLLFNEAVTFAKFNFLLGYLTAQETKRPEWNPGDFFAAKFGSAVTRATSSAGR